MNIFNNLSTKCTTYFYPEFSVLQKIQEHAAKGSPGSLADSLNHLCGSKGYVEINSYKGNYQVHLFFESKEKYTQTSPHLIGQFKTCALPADVLSTHFDAWQTEDKGSHFCLKLSTNQSMALLGFNPQLKDAFKDSQRILQETKEFMSRLAESFPLKELPVELFFRILLSTDCLQVLGRFAQVNRHFSALVSSNVLWRAVAEIQKISLPIGAPSLLASWIPSLHGKQDEQPGLVRNQVKEILPRAYYDALMNLTYIDLQVSFSGDLGLSKEDVEKQGGICVLNAGTDHLYFQGMILYDKKGLQEHVLVFVLSMESVDEKQFQQIMTDTIRELFKSGITPKGFAISTPRWSVESIPGSITSHSVFTYFQNWKKNQKPL